MSLIENLSKKSSTRLQDVSSWNDYQQRGRMLAVPLTVEYALAHPFLVTSINWLQPLRQTRAASYACSTAAVTSEDQRTYLK